MYCTLPYRTHLKPRLGPSRQPCAQSSRTASSIKQLVALFVQTSIVISCRCSPLKPAYGGLGPGITSVVCQRHCSSLSLSYSAQIRLLRTWARNIQRGPSDYLHIHPWFRRLAPTGQESPALHINVTVLVSRYHTPPKSVYCGLGPGTSNVGRPITSTSTLGSEVWLLLMTFPSFYFWFYDGSPFA
jgi:hypothetical protein